MEMKKSGDNLSEGNKPEMDSDKHEHTHKRGIRYASPERKLIVNVFNYFISLKNSVSDAARETSKATGCSQRSVYEFRKESLTNTNRKAKKKARHAGVAIKCDVTSSLKSELDEMNCSCCTCCTSCIYDESSSDNGH